MFILTTLFSDHFVLKNAFVYEQAHLELLRHRGSATPAWILINDVPEVLDRVSNNALPCGLLMISLLIVIAPPNFTCLCLSVLLLTFTDIRY